MAWVREFHGFRLNEADERLSRGGHPIELRPKTYAVLAHLVGRAPSLVTQAELRSAVWGNVEVSSGTLSQSIRELRRAFEDDARQPRFIATVHGRGFRFVAPVRTCGVGVGYGELRAEGDRQRLVGREMELEQLHASFVAAEGGRRQIVFVTGEPGIGKTSLVRSFLAGLRQTDRGAALWIGAGRCVELHGESEAYLPVLEALGRLGGTEEGRAPLRDVLARVAPSWLGQLPGLDASGARGEPVQASAERRTPTRMLRELCEALEELTRERTLVLWLEDLHWADLATLDLLTALARRPDPARLLVLASYRPVDAAVAEHPVIALKRSLLQSAGGHDLCLEPLGESAVAAYVDQRFGGEPGPAVAGAISEQSEGNPLFMVALTDRLAAEASVPGDGRPEASERAAEFLRASGTDTLRELVEARIAKLSSGDVEVLEAASVAGSAFAAQSVAAALGVEALQAEQVCSRLVDWQLFLRDAGEAQWPDGTRAQRYAFLHDVFGRVLYERIPGARRQQLHRRVAERMAAGHPARSGAGAAEIAVHFELGGEESRAVDWLERAASGVRRRFADREAVVYLERALTHLTQQPKSDARRRRELGLRLELAEALMFAAGLASDSSRRNLERGLEIAKTLDDPEATATVLVSLARLHWFRLDLPEARACVDQFFALGSRVEGRALRAFGHVHAAAIALTTGDVDDTFREAETAWKLIATEQDPAVRFVTADPAVHALSALAVAQWLRGQPCRADGTSRQAVDRARGADAFRLFAGLLFRGEFLLYARSIDEVDRVSLELERLQDEHAFPVAFAHEPAREAWRLLQHGDSDAALAHIEAGLATARASHVRLLTSLLLATLAEVRLARREAEPGLAAIEEALDFAQETGERTWEAELHRLRGELLLLGPHMRPAEEAFQRARAVARRQGARLLELRAATSQARLWQREGRKDEARELLGPIVGRFTEGFDTRDLVDAKDLLDSL